MKDSSRAVRIYVLILAALVCCLFLISLTHTNSISYERFILILTFIVFMIAACLFPLEFAAGTRATLDTSVIFASALMFQPYVAMIIAGTGSVIAQLLTRRPFIQTIFNASQRMLQAGCGALLLMVLGWDYLRPDLGTLYSWTPLVLAAIAIFVINTLAVSMVVALQTGKSLVRIWTERARFGILEYISQLAIGALIVVVAYSNKWALPLLLLPAIAVYRALAHHVEARQITQRALDQQRTMTDVMVTSLAEGICALDKEGYITFMNPAACQMLRCTLDEVRNKSFVELVSVEGHDNSLLVNVPLEGKIYRNDDCTFRTLDGGTIQVACTSSPITLDGRIIGVIVAFRDMTEFRRLEQAREEYLSLISHDLRTPLSVVIGHSQILKTLLREKGLEREERNVDAIIGGGRQLTRMVENLLDRASLEAGAVKLKLQRVDLESWLPDAIERVTVPANRSRVHLVIERGCTLDVDVDRIERVLGNLVTNALKYSAPETDVIVRAKVSSNNLIISVKDQGPGIKPEDVPKLFQKYYRTNRGRNEGLGLGLYISRLIVEAHGGHIWVESEPSKGSTFSFSLPIHNLDRETIQADNNK